MNGLACFYIVKPGNVWRYFGICHYRIGIPVIQSAIIRELCLGFLNHGIIKMVAKITVDIERKIQYGSAFVNKHGGSVPAEHLDFLVVCVMGLNLVDIS